MYAAHKMLYRIGEGGIQVAAHMRTHSRAHAHTHTHTHTHTHAHTNTHAHTHTHTAPHLALLQFSMDEPALLDLPAQVDFILGLTGQSQLAIIGHSQGATLPLMMLAARPELNDKLWLLVSMGGVAQSVDVSTPFLRQQISTRSPQVRWVLECMQWPRGSEQERRVQGQVANCRQQS